MVWFCLAWLPRLGTRSEYLFMANRLTHHEASVSCISFGGHLATITSDAEQDFLVQYLPTQ